MDGIADCPTLPYHAQPKMGNSLSYDATLDFMCFPRLIHILCTSVRAGRYMMKNYLDIVKECDNFPYHEPCNTEAYNKQVASLWHFFLPNDTRPRGFLLDSVVQKMPWTPDFRIDSGSPRKEIHLLRRKGDDWRAACNQSVEQVLNTAREKNTFPNLGRKRDENFPIIGAKFPIGIERSASSLFGIIAQGAHMTVYTRTSSGIKFWISQRNPQKPTYPGMFDNTVGGGVAAGEIPFECLVREAGEEAALSEDLVRREACHAGTVTYLNIADHKAGGEPGVVVPGLLYVYDLEVSEDVVFKPVDNDIKAFYLMDEQQVKEQMARNQFKPNCALVLMDFFVRHGIMTAENEPDYVEIVSRLHRKLPFPTH